MMLLNIAEDLKADAKVIVPPAQSKKKEAQTQEGEQKPSSMQDIEDAALKSKGQREDMTALQHEDLAGKKAKVSGKAEDSDDDEDRPDHLYMELRSTATFKDVDVDAMVEATTFDEFMGGIFSGRRDRSAPAGE